MLTSEYKVSGALFKQKNVLGALIVGSLVCLFIFMLHQGFIYNIYTYNVERWQWGRGWMEEGGDTPVLIVVVFKSVTPPSLLSHCEEIGTTLVAALKIL